MIKVPTEQGEITISDAVFTTITGAAATNCFGVKGMAQRSMTDGLVHLLRPEAMSKGVKGRLCTAGLCRQYGLQWHRRIHPLRPVSDPL